MKKKTKKQIIQVVAAVGLGFFAWLLLSFNLKPALEAEATSLVVKNHDLAVSIVTNVTDNIVFYGFAAAIIAVAYYFAKRK